MAEDYLTDDEQLEAVKHAIVEYAPWLIGGAIVGAALFFGIRYYGSFHDERNLKAAAQFDALSTALQTNDPNKPRQIAEALIKDYSSTPYADQAKLAIARLDVEEGKRDRALEPLTQVMNDSKDSELRQIARLRLARVLTDLGKPDEAIKTLSEGAPGAFAGRYHEVRGDALYAKKNFHDAVIEYKAALDAADASGVNAALLELKIQDLGAGTTAPGSVPSVDNLKKATP
jgi:predicted negative regulator of RcsB-dependent stress response